MCRFESDYMDKIENHMSSKHHEMVKELIEDLEMLILQDCSVCRKVLYKTQDFKKHE